MIKIITKVKRMNIIFPFIIEFINPIFCISVNDIFVEDVIYSSNNNNKNENIIEEIKNFLHYIYKILNYLKL
jgi:hypothetical protein